MSETFTELLSRSKSDIDRDLKRHLGSVNSPFADVDSSHYLNRLQQALHYSVLNGGKRIRPLLVHAAAAAVGNDVKTKCLHGFRRAVARRVGRAGNREQTRHKAKLKGGCRRRNASLVGPHGPTI